MININNYCANNPNTPLELTRYSVPQLNAQQILIDVNYCGVCHSDLRFIANDFGDSQYPLVAGHEIIGTVRALGSEATHFKIGEKVAVAWQQGCCGQCTWCQTEHEEVCEKIEAICLTHRGGFAEQMIVNADFAYPLPPELVKAGAAAAPLLCAGTTIFNAILSCNVKTGMRVGVIGIGGLGHLAIKFLHAMQCEVIAFSSTANKKSDAFKFGAKYFIDSINANAIAEFNNTCDVIIYTPDVNLDYAAFFNVLKPFGIFCFAGIPNEAPTLPILPLIIGEKSIKAVTCGNRNTINKMLQFVAKYNILANVEIMPMAEVNQALEKVAQRKMRYRLVLENKQ